jgi:hypothetical protein
MGIYLFCWFFFAIGFIPAFVVGSHAGTSGVIVGGSVGFLFGCSYVFGFWTFMEWFVRNPPRKELYERAWMIIDFTVLPIIVVVLFALPHLSVKFLLNLL